MPSPVVEGDDRGAAEQHDGQDMGQGTQPRRIGRLVFPVGSIAFAIGR